MEGEGLPVLSFGVLSGNIYDPPTQDRNRASEGEMRIQICKKAEEKVREKLHKNRQKRRENIFPPQCRNAEVLPGWPKAK